MMHQKPFEMLQRVFPILAWIPQYSLQKGICDLIAGITVGLTLIPQSIAYAGLAGLGPEYGLYSSLFGGIVYTIFGTVPELNIAPTALVSLLTYQYTHDSSFGAVPAAILLSFLSGIIEIVCGIFHLGFLVNFVSTPVISAFTSAGALTIAAAQLKNIFGLSYKGELFTENIYNVFANIKDTKLWDCLLGFGCCAFLLALRQLKNYGKPPVFEKSVDAEPSQKLKTFLWFASVSRNALLVVICATLAYALSAYDALPFSLTGNVPQGLPQFEIPINDRNGTLNFELLDMIQELGSGVFIVPFISILSNIAIAKSFSQGLVLDATQEMLAVGFCNLVGSFFSAYPISASFSRAAVNNASGCRTTFGGIYTGIMVVLALTFLTPYFAFIPKATLSSVIICAVIFMVEVSLSKLIWKSSKIDMLPFVITFSACLCIGIEYGILIGVLVDVLIVMYYTARPSISVECVKHCLYVEYIRITPKGPLLYATAEYARDMIAKSLVDFENSFKFVIFDASKMQKLDFTAAKCLSLLVNDLCKADKDVVFYKLKPTIAKMVADLCKNKIIFVNSTTELNSLLQEPTVIIQHVHVNEAFEDDDMTSIHMKL